MVLLPSTNLNTIVAAMNDFPSGSSLAPPQSRAVTPALFGAQSQPNDPNQTEPFPTPSFAMHQRQNSFDSLCPPQQPEDSGSYPPSVASNGMDAQQSYDPNFDQSEECLSFSHPNCSYTLLDETSKRVDILLSAQLTGLFNREGQLSDYLACDGTGPAAPTAPVLICYRRNRISIGGHLAIPQGLRCVLNAQGQQIPIVSHELSLSAFESLDDGRGGRLAPLLVQRDGPPTAANDDAEGTSPQPIQLTPEAAEEATHDQEYTIYPFDWKRLQFRRATVNNGKGPDRQKFFVVSIKLLATLADGQKVCISETSSNPVIVRGRGPQNFAKVPSSPEQGRCRSKSLNSTLDGRLRKLDRRSTRNSLLRQSLSRKPMTGAQMTAAMQAISGQDNPNVHLVTPSFTQAPISPPVTPYAHMLRNQEAAHRPLTPHAILESSPEPNFTLPPASSNAWIRPSYPPMPSKDEFDDMMRHNNFDLGNNGLNILTPMSPNGPQKSHSMDSFPLPSHINDAARASGRSPSPNNPAFTAEPASMLPITPSSHAEDAEMNTSSAPQVKITSFFEDNNNFAKNSPFLMVQDNSPGSMMNPMCTMPENLINSYSMETSLSTNPSPQGWTSY